jgi:hypothetical protein
VLLSLLLVAAQTPLEARCQGNPLIETRIGQQFTAQTASFIWTQDQFAPQYLAYPPLVFPPWSDTTPFTPAFEATFWALGTGLWDNAGGYTVPPYQWVDYNPTYYGAGFYAAELFTGWGASSSISGCIQNNPPGTCTCVLLTDQDGTNGYFAMVSSPVEVGIWHAHLNQPGADPAGNFLPIILKPIQAPAIVDAVSEPAGSDMQVTASLDPVTMGIYNASGLCEDCGPSGYKVKAQILPNGSAPPQDRSTELWTELALAGGGTQSVTPLGSTVTVEITACPPDSYVWLATELHFDSDFASPVVSENSSLLECSSSIHEVEIDIMPSSINPRSYGVIPVALLGREDFSVADLDVTTLRFGPDEASPAHDLTDTWTYNDHMQDVNLDGFMDLMMHFLMQETGIGCGHVAATLAGNMLAGQAIEGTDSFRTVGCRLRLPVHSRPERQRSSASITTEEAVDVSFEKQE